MQRIDRHRLSAWLAGLLLVTLASVAPAQQALDDFRSVLPRLPAPVRAELQRHADQWTQWTPAQRQAFAARAAAWDALPRRERVARRERYHAWRALSPAEQARLQAAAAYVAHLPASQQQALRAQFDGLDRSTRRGWLLGPELGADYAGLQPLLAQVPAAEHADLLRVLRAMTPRQRDDLAALVQRTPPQARAALRRELVSTAAANRDEWLWQRLQHL